MSTPGEGTGSVASLFNVSQLTKSKSNEPGAQSFSQVPLVNTSMKSVQSNFGQDWLVMSERSETTSFGQDGYAQGHLNNRKYNVAAQQSQTLNGSGLLASPLSGNSGSFLIRSKDHNLSHISSTPPSMHATFSHTYNKSARNAANDTVPLELPMRSGGGDDDHTALMDFASIQEILKKGEPSSRAPNQLSSSCSSISSDQMKTPFAARSSAKGFNLRTPFTPAELAIQREVEFGNQKAKLSSSSSSSSSSSTHDVSTNELELSLAEAQMSIERARQAQAHQSNGYHSNLHHYQNLFSASNSSQSHNDTHDAMRMNKSFGVQSNGNLSQHSSSSVKGTTTGLPRELAPPISSTFLSPTQSAISTPRKIPASSGATGAGALRLEELAKSLELEPQHTSAPIGRISAESFTSPNTVHQRMQSEQVNLVHRQGVSLTPPLSYSEQPHNNIPRAASMFITPSISRPPWNAFTRTDPVGRVNPSGNAPFIKQNEFVHVSGSESTNHGLGQSTDTTNIPTKPLHSSHVENPLSPSSVPIIRHRTSTSMQAHDFEATNESIALPIIKESIPEERIEVDQDKTSLGFSELRHSSSLKLGHTPSTTSASNTVSRREFGSSTRTTTSPKINDRSRFSDLNGYPVDEEEDSLAIESVLGEAYSASTKNGHSVKRDNVDGKIGGFRKARDEEAEAGAPEEAGADGEAEINRSRSKTDVAVEKRGENCKNKSSCNFKEDEPSIDSGCVVSDYYSSVSGANPFHLMMAGKSKEGTLAASFENDLFFERNDKLKAESEAVAWAFESRQQSDILRVTERELHELKKRHLSLLEKFEQTGKHRDSLASTLREHLSAIKEGLGYFVPSDSSPLAACAATAHTPQARELLSRIPSSKTSELDPETVKEALAVLAASTFRGATELASYIARADELEGRDNVLTQYHDWREYCNVTQRKKWAQAMINQFRLRKQRRMQLKVVSAWFQKTVTRQRHRSALEAIQSKSKVGLLSTVWSTWRSAFIRRKEMEHQGDVIRGWRLRVKLHRTIVEWSLLARVAASERERRSFMVARCLESTARRFQNTMSSALHHWRARTTVDRECARLRQSGILAFNRVFTRLCKRRAFGIWKRQVGGLSHLLHPAASHIAGMSRPLVVSHANETHSVADSKATVQDARITDLTHQMNEMRLMLQKAMSVQQPQQQPHQPQFRGKLPQECSDSSSDIDTDSDSDNGDEHAGSIKHSPLVKSDLTGRSYVKKLNAEPGAVLDPVRYGAEVLRDPRAIAELKRREKNALKPDSKKQKKTSKRNVETNSQTGLSKFDSYEKSTLRPNQFQITDPTLTAAFGTVELNHEADVFEAKKNGQILTQSKVLRHPAVHADPVPEHPLDKLLHPTRCVHMEGPGPNGEEFRRFSSTHTPGPYTDPKHGHRYVARDTYWMHSSSSPSEKMRKYDENSVKGLTNNEGSFFKDHHQHMPTRASALAYERATVPQGDTQATAKNISPDGSVNLVSPFEPQTLHSAKSRPFPSNCSYSTSYQTDPSGSSQSGNLSVIHRGAQNMYGNQDIPEPKPHHLVWENHMFLDSYQVEDMPPMKSVALSGLAHADYASALGVTEDVRMDEDLVSQAKNIQSKLAEEKASSRAAARKVLTETRHQIDAEDNEFQVVVSSSSSKVLDPSDSEDL